MKLHKPKAEICYQFYLTLMYSLVKLAFITFFSHYFIKLS